MFEALIISIAGSIIANYGTSYLSKMRLKLQKRRIVKKLQKKIQEDILSKFGDEPYYNDLDSFLTGEEFAENLISYCFNPATSEYKSIQSYLKYLLDKFVNKHRYKMVNDIYQTLYVISKNVFNIINDYSKDETSRIIIAQIEEFIGENLTEIIDQNNLLLELSKKENTTSQNGQIEVDFYSSDILKTYKTSLKTYYHNEYDYIPRNIFIEGSVTEESASDALLRRQKILLLGEPGCGKTYEAINTLREICSNEQFVESIPVYLKLKEYGLAYKSILEAVRKQLEPYFGNASEQQILKELSGNKFFLILDGADEILDKKSRIIFFSDINRLLCASNAYFFITSRVNSYYGNIKNIAVYNIKDLTMGQIQNEFYKKGIHTTISDQLYELFASPLFLQIGIRVLQSQRNSKIYNKSMLFNAYFEEICYKRDQVKQLTEPAEKNYHDILMSIGELAFRFFERESLTIDEFDGFFSGKSLGYSTLNICDVFRLDIFDVDKTITYSHQQFKEYFVAYYLVNKYDFKRNHDLYHALIKNELWQEVIIFAVGLIGDIDDQNIFLDMVLTTNLKTYISCVKYKNDLSSFFEDFSYKEYTEKYLNTLYHSYMLLVNTYFPNLLSQFEPYDSKDKNMQEGKKACLIGYITPDRKSIHYWYDWRNAGENLVQVMTEAEVGPLYKEMERRAVRERRNISTHMVNLESSGLMGDTARQVAINNVYNNIKNILKTHKLFESDYILYEKLCTQTKKIDRLKDKTLPEIADWANKYVEDAYKEFDSSEGGILVGVHDNKIDIIDLRNIATYLVRHNGSHEKLSLPSPDLPLKSGLAWAVYSPERVLERLRVFFLWRQCSFHEMVESNFPRMKEYFSLSKDSPYKYRIHVTFETNEETMGDPHITYYRVAIKPGDSSNPEIIVDGSEGPSSDEIFAQIRESYSQNGKEGEAISITSTGFRMVLTSTRNGGNTPLTDMVYRDFENEFKKLFEQ